MKSRPHFCSAGQFSSYSVQVFRPSVENRSARAIICRVLSTHVRFVRDEAGEGGQRGADRCARRDGPATEGRLVIELDAPCFVLRAWQIVWTPALF